jgi:hypothetical protein
VVEQQDRDLDAARRTSIRLGVYDESVAIDRSQLWRGGAEADPCVVLRSSSSPPPYC